VPEVRAGNDLAALLAATAEFAAGDILVVAHKVVSKAEGRVRALAAVEPGERARDLAAEHGKDPRLVQVVLDESAQVLRAHHGVLICLTHHGFVCANAGVDRSNSPGDDQVVLLPADPDASARALRAALPGHPAVVVTDSFGRAWRVGQTDVAIGAAGIAPLDDWRGRPDARGREMEATEIAVADAVAGAADLARCKDGGTPAVLVRGLERFVTEADGPGAAALRRPPELDLFR
jgi:coenzyme F420-0:L-glutamate ligase/coenzyme F420-1:gamma-L-glutamate ligase